MADFIYTPALALLGKGINLETDDIRALIVMANTTAGSEEDAAVLADFTTLDEYDGSGYARVALTSKSMSPDTVNDRGGFTSDPIVFPSLGIGTRAGFALIIYKHVTDDTDSIPIAYKVPAAWPFTGNGQDVTTNPHATGWFYNKNG